MRILFVDDDRYSISRYVEAMEIEGFDVSTAFTAGAALDLVERGIEFDVVIIDIMMDSGDLFDRVQTHGGFRTGLVLAREIRKLLPRARLVALTHSEDEEVKWLFGLMPLSLYLRKINTNPRMLAPTLISLLGSGGPKQLPQAFIVHGRDDAAVAELRNFLKDELYFREPMVLADLPTDGLTVIEKFERYAMKADVVLSYSPPTT